MAFTGCSSEPEIAPEMQPIRLELTAGTTTRTEIGPDNKISWSDTGETLKVLEQVGDATFSALDNDGYTKEALRYPSRQEPRSVMPPFIPKLRM